MRVITQYGKTRIQPSGRDDAVTIRKNSTGSLYTRRIINLIEGSNSTLTVADDDTGDEVDVTITSASGNIIGGGTPSIAAGPGAGTGPTVSITGTDRAGVISVTCGTTPSGAASIIATITFSTAFATAPPIVIVTPANPNAAAIGTNGVFVSNGTTTTTFKLNTNTTASLVDGIGYLWYFFVPY